MKINFSFKKKKSLVRGKKRSLFEFLENKIKPFIFALFLVLAGICFYVWYLYVYDPNWSEEKKEEYMKSVDKEVTFDRKNFQAILEKINLRKEKYAQKMENMNDIFRVGE